METKKQFEVPFLDDDLIAVFKETFAGDDILYQEAIEEARRAFVYIEQNELWNNNEI